MSDIFWSGLIVGVVIGGILGVLVGGLLGAAARGDEDWPRGGS